MDEAFNEVKRRMVEVLRRDSSMVDVAIDYLMIAKYLERLGDHAVNICEWTEFYKTGIPPDRPLTDGKNRGKRELLWHS